jgi:ABC-2 type transport system ATP-binding protein
MVSDGVMLQVEAVSKQYPLPAPLLRPLVRVAARQPVDALSDVSFEVSRGEVVGLVGPNGAGKSTLIRVIATLLEATSGTVTVDGHDVARHPREVRRRLGLVLEGDRGLYGRLRGQENLEFFGVLFGLAPRVARRRAEELMEMMELAGRDKLVFGYSSGMRARLSLARALLADPPLLVLDEPSRSLDPVASLQMGERLRSSAAQGRTILFSSHRLDEITTFCDRVVVLIDGGVRFVGAPDGLNAQFLADRVQSP